MKCVNTLAFTLVLLSIPQFWVQTSTAQDTASETAQLRNAVERSQKGVEFYSSGKFDEALEASLESLAIFERIKGVNDPDTASLLDTVGIILMAKGEYDESRKYLEKAVQSRRQVYGQSHLKVAVSLNNLATLFKRIGDYSSSLENYQAAESILSETQGASHPVSLNIKNNIAQLLVDMGQYETARDMIEDCIQIREQSGQNSTIEHAVTVANLAAVYKRMGDFDKAIELDQKALEQKIKIVGENHVETAISYNNLGLVYLNTGRLLEAESYLNKAFVIEKSLYGEGNPELIANLSNLASLEQAKGNLEAAEARYRQAISIARNSIGLDHPLAISVVNNLADVLFSQGDFKDAKNLYEVTLKLRRQKLGDRHPDVAVSLTNLARAQGMDGDTTSARSSFEQALSSSRDIHGKYHPAVAVVLNNFGLLESDCGNFEAARSLYQQSLEINQRVYGSDHDVTIRNLANLVTIDVRTKNYSAAYQKMDQVIRPLVEYITDVLPGLPEWQQLQFLSSNFKAYQDGAFDLGLLVREDAELIAMASEWVINSKALSHEALVTRSQGINQSGDEDLNEIEQGISETRKKLARLKWSKADPGSEQNIKRQIEALEQKLESLLGRAHRETGSEPGRLRKWVQVSDVQDSLDAKSVLLDIVRFTDFEFNDGKLQARPARYACWVITPNQAPLIIDLGLASEIEQAVSKVTGTIASSVKGDSLLKSLGEADAEEQLKLEFEDIVRIIWNPIFEKIPDATEDLVISPDGSLWLLPWAAIPIAEDKYLLEQFSLRFEISGREVVKDRSSNVTPRTPLIFADPDYDLQTSQMEEAIKAIFPKLNLDDEGTTRGLKSRTAISSVPRLPNTKLEALAVSPNMGKIANKEPVSYLGKYALESVVKRIRNPRYLMLSTHGFFLPDQQGESSATYFSSSGDQVGDPAESFSSNDGQPLENPLLRCGLLFSGCNSDVTVGNDDGILTGIEVVGIDLRATELVVLSACETGIGKVNNGQGVAGLRQAFQLAGAQSVMSTLWQIPDRESALIMNEFFKQLADGVSKSGSLRNAQLKRIQSRRQRYVPPTPSIGPHGP